jgi:hypothetical protein
VELLTGGDAHVTIRMKQVLAIGALVAILAIGAGVAAADSIGNDQDAFLNDVAKRLNVTPEELKSAFQGALADKLDADVKAGRLTQEQADRIKKEAQQRGGVPFPGPGRFHDGPPPVGGPGGPPPPGGPGGPPPRGPHGPGGPRGPGGPFAAGFDAAAKYLGLTDMQLDRQLESGKSLAQVAGDRNKDVAGLKSAIEAAVKADLDKAVADRRLTQQQEDKILSGLHSRIDGLVNRKGGDRPPRPRWRRGPHW